MKRIYRFYKQTNKTIKFLISALIQIAFYILLISFFENVLLVSDLSVKTPKFIIYTEALVFYLLSKVAKMMVDIFRAYMKSRNPDDNDDNDSDNEENSEENDEDFF